jgi:hypothetical protein
MRVGVEGEAEESKVEGEVALQTLMPHRDVTVTNTGGGGR